MEAARAEIVEYKASLRTEAEELKVAKLEIGKAREDQRDEAQEAREALEKGAEETKATTEMLLRIELDTTNKELQSERQAWD